MTTYYYSASTRGFYAEAVHGKNMPSDVVMITEEEWTALLQAQASGQEIAADEHSRPVAVARSGGQS